MRTIEIVDYQVEWKSAFEELSDYLKSHLSITNPRIEHIGSTSVIGLAAKPIIDLVIVIDNESDFQQVKTDLEHIDYLHIGDQGIAKREVFKLIKPNKFYPHHLYVAYKNALSLKNHLVLRNHLRDHPEDVKRYADLKKELAIKFTHDIDSYVEGKTEFIVSILKQYDFPSQHLNEIISSNKKTPQK